MNSRLWAFRHDVRLRGHPESAAGYVRPAQAGLVAAGPKARFPTASFAP